MLNHEEVEVEELCGVRLRCAHPPLKTQLGKYDISLNLFSEILADIAGLELSTPDVFTCSSCARDCVRRSLFHVNDDCEHDRAHPPVPDCFSG